MVPHIILGAGGHGRVVADVLLATDRVIAGFTDLAREDAVVVGGRRLPILGDDSTILDRAPDSVWLANGLGWRRNDTHREGVFCSFSRLGYRFAVVRHPSAILSEGTELGAGAQVLAGAVVETGVRIGFNSVINTGALVNHDCRVGDHAFVGPGANLLGGVTIGDCAVVGAGAVVLPGVVIGAKAIVGAGAVVVHDVEAGTCVIGVPARRSTNE